MSSAIGSYFQVLADSRNTFHCFGSLLDSPEQQLGGMFLMPGTVLVFFKIRNVYWEEHYHPVGYMYVPVCYNR